MKDNNKQPEQPNNPAPPPTVKCFVVPVDAMEQIRDALREAPYKTAFPIIQQLGTLQVMDVPIRQGPPNG